MIEKVSSVKCQVLSRAGRAGSLPRPLTSDLTLQTPGGTPAPKAYRAKQSQLAGGAGRDAVRLYKQTQFPARRVGRGPGDGGHGGKCAKQSQTWASWGIWGIVSRVLYKQTQFGGTPAAACRLGPAWAGCTNKPNSAASRRGSRYKQTQFFDCGLRIWAPGRSRG
jgi:hypothetical protein